MSIILNKVVALVVISEGETLGETWVKYCNHWEGSTKKRIPGEGSSKYKGLWGAYARCISGSKNQFPCILVHIPFPL